MSRPMHFFGGVGVLGILGGGCMAMVLLIIKLLHPCDEHDDPSRADVCGGVGA